jgi:hypothetical protein
MRYPSVSVAVNFTSAPELPVKVNVRVKVTLEQATKSQRGVVV